MRRSVGDSVLFAPWRLNVGGLTRGSIARVVVRWRTELAWPLSSRGAMTPRFSLAPAVLLSLAVSCGGGERSENGRPTTHATQEAPTPPDPAPETPEWLSCEDPFSYLAHYSRADLPAAYCGACECDEMEWPVLDWARSTERTACAELEYAALRVGAYLGEEIPAGEWRAYFENLEDFRAPQTAVRSDVGEQNLRWLRGLGSECEPAVSDADRQRVLRWFARLAEGEPEVPARILLDDEASTWEVVLPILSSEWTVLTPRTPIMPDESGPDSFLVTIGGRGSDCVGDAYEAGCDFNLYVVLSFGGNGRAEAVSVVQPAACPFVYVERGGSLNYAGEILRNMDRPELRGEQGLILNDIDCSNGTVRVVLAEEKREVTYLDSLWLIVDGRRVEPRQVISSQVLRQGDRLEATFDVSTTCTHVELMASGYYVPTQRLD